MQLYFQKSVIPEKTHKLCPYSVNTSQNLMIQRQSTRNNSFVESLMMEDVTATDLADDSVTLNENVLEYNCMDCNFLTTCKENMSKHTDQQHKRNVTEEVKFVCIDCLQEFSQECDYNEHCKTHEENTVNENSKVEEPPVNLVGRDINVTPLVQEIVDENKQEEGCQEIDELLNII